MSVQIRRVSAGRAAGLAASLMVVLVLVVTCTPTPAPLRTWVEFSPSEADPAVDFGPDALSLVGAPTATPKDHLVVLFAGTGASPASMGYLVTELQRAGYHVLGIHYDSRMLTLEACPDAEQSVAPDCHRSFRGEVAFGQDVADPAGARHDHPDVQVPAANSAMSGLLHGLEYVATRFPSDGFEQYLQKVDGACEATNLAYGVCEPRWDRVSLMGFSQGGGVALYLSKFHDVARVGMLSAAFDAYATPEGPVAAPWVSEGGFATPSSDIAHLSHLGDANLFRQRAVAEALGLPGPEVNIRLEAAPFSGSNRLVSDYTPACSPDDSLSQHNSTGGNGCSSVNAYRAAWLYLVRGATAA